MSTFCYWLVARIFSINDKISNLLRTRTHHSIPLSFANVIKFGSQVAYHQRRGTGIQTKISNCFLDYCILSYSRHSTDTMLVMYPWLSHLDFPDVFFFLQCQVPAPMILQQQWWTQLSSTVQLSTSLSILFVHYGGGWDYLGFRVVRFNKRFGTLFTEDIGPIRLMRSSILLEVFRNRNV